MTNLTVSEGRLFGAIFESMLFGIHLILFSTMLYLFSKQKDTGISQRIRVTIICIIFSLCAVHQAAVMRGLQIAFFKSDSSDMFYNDRTQPIDLVQKSVYAAATFLGDGLLIHRLYVIFSHNWKAIVLPCMSLVATTALWIALIHTYHLSKPGSTLYFPPILRLAPSAFIMSFFTNVVITIMVVIRIALAMRAVRHISSSDRFYRKFLGYTVESGLVYPTALLINGVFFLRKDNALEILSGSNTQFLGIVPLLLTLQVQLDLSIYDSAIKKSSTSIDVISTMRFGSKPTLSVSPLEPSDTELGTGSHTDHDGVKPQGSPGFFKENIEPLA